MSFLQLLLFAVVSIAGGYLGQRLKLPIGNLTGAMFAVGFFRYFHLITIGRSVPMGFLVQILIGMILGLSFIKLDKGQLRSLSAGLFIIGFGVLLMGFGIGALVSKITNLDMNLSILSSAPGGIPEMASTAQALQLNAPVIVVIHLVRVLTVMTLFSTLLEYFHQKSSRGESVESLD